MVGGGRNSGVSNEQSKADEAIRAVIVRYLRSHPRACDTVEGIRLWWLAPTGLIAMRISVEAVLERMVAEGALRRVQLPDGNRIYGAATSASSADDSEPG